MAPECPNVPSCREPYDCLTELQFQNPIWHCITASTNAASWTLADIYGLLIWNRACVSKRAGRDEGIYLVAVEMCHLKKPTLIEWIFKKVLVLEYVYLYMCNIELTIFPRCWAERVSLRVNTFPHTEISLHTPGLESSVKPRRGCITNTPLVVRPSICPSDVFHFAAFSCEPKNIKHFIWIIKGLVHLKMKTHHLFMTFQTWMTEVLLLEHKRYFEEHWEQN